MTRVLTDDEYLVKLREKCQEELNEYNTAQTDQECLNADPKTVVKLTFDTADHPVK
jgi:hypothetical protein